MGQFVEVYSKTTGRKQVVPARWLDHPRLGRDFQTTPKARARRGAQTSTAQVETPVEQADSSSAVDKTPENGDKE